MRNVIFNCRMKATKQLHPGVIRLSRSPPTRRSGTRMSGPQNWLSLTSVAHVTHFRFYDPLHIRLSSLFQFMLFPFSLLFFFFFFFIFMFLSHFFLLLLSSYLYFLPPFFLFAYFSIFLRLFLSFFQSLFFHSLSFFLSCFRITVHYGPMEEIAAILTMHLNDLEALVKPFFCSLFFFSFVFFSPDTVGLYFCFTISTCHAASFPTYHISISLEMV